MFCINAKAAVKSSLSFLLYFGFPVHPVVRKDSGEASTAGNQTKSLGDSLKQDAGWLALWLSGYVGVVVVVCVVLGAARIGKGVVCGVVGLCVVSWCYCVVVVSWCLVVSWSRGAVVSSGCGVVVWCCEQLKDWPNYISFVFYSVVLWLMVVGTTCLQDSKTYHAHQQWFLLHCQRCRGTCSICRSGLAKQNGAFFTLDRSHHHFEGRIVGLVASLCGKVWDGQKWQDTRQREYIGVADKDKERPMRHTPKKCTTCPRVQLYL